MTQDKLKKLQKKIDNAKQDKEKGCVKYIIGYSAAMALGLSIGRLITEKQVSLLYAILTFVLIAILRFFFWKGLDQKVANLEEEVKTGIKVKSKASKGAIGTILLIFALIFCSQIFKSDITRYFYEKNSRDESLKSFTITSDNAATHTLNIPNNYLQDNHLGASETLASVSLSGHPRVSVNLQDMAPYYLTKAYDEVLRKISSYKTIYISNYTTIDADYLSFIILPKSEPFVKEDTLKAYDKSFKGGLDNAKKEEKFGLTIYNGPMNYSVKQRSGSYYTFTKNMSLIVSEDEKYSLNLFSCEQNSCFLAVGLEKTNAMIFFNKSHLKNWKDLIDKVEIKIRSFEALEGTSESKVTTIHNASE